MVRVKVPDSVRRATAPPAEASVVLPLLPANLRMRSLRLPFVALPLAAAALAACRSDTITSENRPPLAGVRYINAVNDTGRVDIKMIDQLEYSANTIDGAGGIVFRAGTRYFPTEAKARHIRVFSFQDSSIATVGQVMVDTTITFVPNKNYTLLLVGSARAAVGAADRMRFVQIEDAPAANDASIQLRFYNAGSSPVDFYTTSATVAAGSSVSGTPAAGLAPRAASAYAVRSVGTFAVTMTNPGSTTSLATVAAADGTAGTPSTNPVAGATVPGTAFSAFAFAPAVAGSGAVRGLSTAATNALLAPGVQLFVDRLPPNTVATP